ncbi:MAG: DUF4334 domain-containing protein [Candidatus Neomicrothrix subdominans]
MATAAERAHQLRSLASGTTTSTALEFFDSLPTVRIDQLLGSWRGSGIATGHPLDGLLEHLGWHGKRFEGPDGAHPLLFEDSRGGVVSINPAFTPLGLVTRHAAHLRRPIAVTALRLLRPLLTTARPRARLRMTTYRGRTSATMCYDALPVHDIFRRVDADTLLGVMDQRGAPRPFVFALHRDSSASSAHGGREPAART